VELDSLVVDLARYDRPQLQLSPGDDAVSPTRRRSAAYQSGFWVGEQTLRLPSERTSSKLGTWLPNEPAASWFLPWMSLRLRRRGLHTSFPGDGRKKRAHREVRIFCQRHSRSAVRIPVSGRS